MDDLLRRALGENIQLETVIGGGLWNTFAAPNPPENAILNLGSELPPDSGPPVEGAVLLPKPYDLARLRGALEQVAAGR